MSNNAENNKKLFIFDLGDVILLGNRKVREMASELGINEDEFLSDYRTYQEAMMLGYVSTSDYYHHLENNFGVKVESELFLDNYRPYVNKPLLNMIKILKENGNRVVVGSNTFLCYKTWIDSYAPYLLSLFDKLYLSYEIHRSKPNKTFFTYIMEEEGFSASDTYFIDDREDNIDAASALGINTLRYDRDDSKLKSYLFCN